MEKRVKYALVLLAGIVLALAVLFPETMLQWIIEPIATVFWAAWRVAASVDQSVYWGALIVMCAIAAIRLLPHEPNRPGGPARLHKPEARAQVDRWQTLIENAEQGDEQRTALRDNLRALLASSINPRGHSGTGGLEEEMRAQDISLPNAAYRYLFSDAKNSAAIPNDRQAQSLSWPPHWLRRWIKRGTAFDNSAIDELLRWMESNMEVRNDQ